MLGSLLLTLVLQTSAAPPPSQEASATDRSPVSTPSRNYGLEPEEQALARLRRVKSHCLTVVLRGCETISPKDEDGRKGTVPPQHDPAPDPEAAFRQAQTLERKGELEPSRDLYELYLHSFPKGSFAKEARRGLARINPHLEMRTYDPRPLFAARSIEAGDYYFEKGMLKNAIGHYQQAIERYPEGTVALFRLAQAYEQLRDLDQAQELYQKYLELRPTGKFAEACRQAMERLAVPAPPTSAPAETSQSKRSPQS